MNYQILFDLEQKLHNPVIRINQAEFNNLLSDDFFEFGFSGIIYNKQEVIPALVDEISSVCIEGKDF